VENSKISNLALNVSMQVNTLKQYEEQINTNNANANANALAPRNRKK
jgi:hypothetical protein